MSKNIGNTKLTEEKVKYIKSMLGKMSIEQLAIEFNVSESCINAIKHGKSWRNI